MTRIAALLVALCSCERAADAIEQPPPRPVPPIPPMAPDASTVPVRPACEIISISLDEHAMRIDASPYHCATTWNVGAPEAGWLERELAQIAARLDPTCRPQMLLRVQPAVVYGDIVPLLGASRRAGLPDITFAVGEDVVPRPSTRTTCAP